jgi:hypothetical protein
MSIMQEYAHRCSDSVISHFVNLNSLRETLDKKIKHLNDLRKEEKKEKESWAKRFIYEIKRKNAIRNLENELFYGG